MPLEIARIRAVCFDVDGTLRETDDQFVLRLRELLHPLRFLFPRRDCQALARWLVMRAETPATFLYGLPDWIGLDGALNRWGERLNDRRPRNQAAPAQVVAGVPMLLERLQVHYPMAVVSARGRRDTLFFLEQSGLSSFFGPVATGQTCRHTKPYPDPICWAAEKMGVPAAHCLMVGDTVVDIQAGRAAGAQTVGVLCGFGEEAELRRAGADLILSSTAELQAILLDPAHRTNMCNDPELP